VYGCGSEVSSPPLAVPPLSCTVTSMEATPNSLEFRAKVSVPDGLTAGAIANIDAPLVTFTL
jgi:hypothetical protein